MIKNALMTHIVGGYPTLKASQKIAETMLEAGVNFLEIQIPFSDPIADGPTIAAANQKALKNGITPDDCFMLLKKLTKKTATPILLMTYYNIPFRYGVKKFCIKARAAGCYGLIIPDIPMDEEPYDHYLQICKKEGLHAIQVISLNTPVRRLKKIGTVASGFVYCVTRVGTTGMGGVDQMPSLQKIRQFIKTPIALGFGIRNKKDVARAQKRADIAVIGSKIIDLYNTAPRTQKLKTIRSFLDPLVSKLSINYNTTI